MVVRRGPGPGEAGSVYTSREEDAPTPTPLSPGTDTCEG